MRAADSTTSNPLPPFMHLVGAACSLRLPRRLLHHHVELFCSQGLERVRIYGRAATRDDSILVQFNSFMKPDGQLERHTVFFPVLGKHRIAVYGTAIEVVQIVHRRIHVEHISTDHAPVTEISLLFYIVANWRSLLQGQRRLVSVIRLPQLRVHTCELARGDAYFKNGESRIDIALRAQNETERGTLVATDLPAVLTFDAETKHPVSLKVAPLMPEAMP